MSESKAPKRRKMTAKTRLLTVVEAIEMTGVGVDDTVGTLVGLLEKDAIYGIYNQ